jgi:hypothetical protein
MTVQTEIKRVVQVGTGATKTFYFNATVQGLDDLKVYTVTPAGVQTLQVRGGAATYDYVMTINSSTKFATVTLNNFLAAGYKVVILRGTPITQVVDYVEGDPFPAETHESALDKLTIIATQLQEQLDRSLQVVETSTVTGIRIAELQATKALVVNAAGTAIEMGPTTSDIANASANAATASAAALSASSSASSASSSAAAAAATLAAAGLPALVPGDELKFIRIKADRSGYETIAPPQDNSTLYGFRISTSTLLLDKSVIGVADSFDVTNFEDYFIGASGNVFSVNANGHLICTLP